MPIVPFAAAAALLGIINLRKSRWGAILVTILIISSGVNTVLSLALTPYFPPQFSAPFAQLVLPSLAEGAGLPNHLSSIFGIAPPVAVVVIALVVIAALTWATMQLLEHRNWWLPAVSLAVAAAVLLVYSWQGSSPTAEEELMRSQVLRRLGHHVIADRIDESINAPSG
jgi:hypothetical protein